MMPSYPLYFNYQLPVLPEMLALPIPSIAPRSFRSSKASSRRNTDIDSQTKFKTESCKYWKNQKQCPFGENCNFAHGNEQKRTRETLPFNYKTRSCLKFKENGYCPYGQRCQFIHTQQRNRVPHAEAMNCLAFQSQKFFSFLEERELMNCKGRRLAFFESLSSRGERMDVMIQWGECQNYVDVRSRHNSF